jgi:hypothetical protein
MDISFYLATLSVIPLFAFRAFVPLAATAFVARFGVELTSWVDAAGVTLLEEIPSWATDDTALLILGVFAVIEVMLQKVPETRDVLRYSDTQLKAIAAFLTCFYLVEGDPRELFEHIRQEGLSTGFAWGQSFAYTWSFGIGSTVWFVATLRRGMYSALTAVDEDDSIGLVRVLSWMEDAIGFFGVAAALLLPGLAVVLAGFAVVALEVVRRGLEARERRQLAPCGACQTPNHLSAVECAQCRERFPAPSPVGWLGVARVGRVDDLDAHRLRLIGAKRCRSCATRLVERRLDQQCPACDTPVFPDEAALDRYMEHLRARLPKTLLVCLVLGSVPLLGLIPGILYYRISLIASLRYYIPRTMGMFARICVRVLNLILLMLQVVPLVGAVTLPLMCWLNHAVYGAAVRRRAPALGRAATAA